MSTASMQEPAAPAPAPAPEPEPEPQRELTRRSDTTRDQRRDAQLMRRLGYTQSAISRELGLSLGQVQYALSHPETPITRPGRPSKLSEAQVEQLKAFMAASKENEQMPFAKIPQALGWDVGEYCIRHALRKMGYKRPAGGGRRKTTAAAREPGRKRTTVKGGGVSKAVPGAGGVSPEAASLAALAALSASPAASLVDPSNASSTASPGASFAEQSAASLAELSAASLTASPAAPEPGPEPESGSGSGQEAEAEQEEGDS